MSGEELCDGEVGVEAKKSVVRVHVRLCDQGVGHGDVLEQWVEAAELECLLLLLRTDLVDGAVIHRSAVVDDTGDVAALGGQDVTLRLARVDRLRVLEDVEGLVSQLLDIVASVLELDGETLTLLCGGAQQLVEHAGLEEPIDVGLGVVEDVRQRSTDEREHDE